MRLRTLARLPHVSALFALCLVGCGGQPKGGIPRGVIAFAACDQDLAPRLVSEVNVDSGEVEASFSLTNSSLEVKEAIFQGTSCGCTGAFVDGRLLKPDDKVVVERGQKVQVALRSHLGNGPGVRTYRATFGLAAGTTDQDLLTVAAHWHVIKDVAIDPEVLSCDFTAADVHPLEKTIQVTRTFRTDKPTSLSPVLSGLSPQVEVLKITEAEPLTRLEGDLWKQSWFVKLSVKPPNGSANVSALGRGMVSFGRDGGKSAVGAEFPIIIHRVYGIEAPELSHFGDVPSGERRSRRVVIRSADGREFRVLAVRTAGDGFSASGEADKAAKSHIMEVAFLASKPGSFLGQLTVDTDHLECPTLRIELAATVPSAIASTGGEPKVTTKQ